MKGTGLFLAVALGLCASASALELDAAQKQEFAALVDSEMTAWAGRNAEQIGLHEQRLAEVFA